MSTYVINKNVYAGTWKEGRSVCLIEGRIRPYILDPEEYELLKCCDGSTPIESSKLTDRLQALGILRKCDTGTEHIASDQIASYPNHFVEFLDWTITDRCNYNCLHCFHAADNTVHRDEFSLEEAMKFLDDIRECGIRNISLTGGEPTLYPYFREVIKGIRERGMWLNYLITNGALLTPELLSFLKEYHPKARIRISFDGIGWHDWLRQHKGSEAKTLEAIRSCKEAGFPVHINSNVHRKNQDVMFDTVQMLADQGVDHIRIIRTTEAPRWELNKENNTLSPEEYYDFSLRFARKYLESDISIPVVIWQCLLLDNQRHVIRCLAAKSESGCLSEQAVICSSLLKKPSVQANGEIVPCAPMGGYLELHGMHFGNVHKTPLKELLTESTFMDAILSTVGEKFRQNEKCASCTYARWCQGGCPALSLLSGGSIFSSDEYKCIFFREGYYDKIQELIHA